MSKTFLIAMNFAAYILFIFKCFTLIEGMLFGKNYSILFRFIIGVFNAALMVVMAFNIPINLLYTVTVLVLYLELLVFFKKSLKDTLFVTVVIMMNIMCLRGMVISLFALVTDGTLYEVCSTPNLFLMAIFVSNILEWLALYIILHYISMSDLRFAMRNRTQSWYIIIWASLCVLFMFRSSGVYVRDDNYPSMFIDHMSYCFILLLSFYYLLIYTFKINRAAEIREINKRLSKALGNQMKLQSALTRDAIFSTQANLTQNRIISGLEIYSESIERLNDEYDAWFKFAEAKIHSSDHGIFYKSLERENLLENYSRGVEPKPFEYRRKGDDGDYHWVRLVLRVFKDIETDDVLVFGYAFDIEKEVNERSILLYNAQTDLFTGLYNKATTERIIGEEIRKGAGMLLLLDIDNFKDINDHFGHEAGDVVLKRISELLLLIFRQCDIIGRIGGDEFMIYLKDTTDISIAEERGTEILTRLKTGAEYGEHRIFVTVSIGIVVVDEKIDSFSVAYNRADCALYRAKRSGKNCYSIYNESSRIMVN